MNNLPQGWLGFCRVHRGSGRPTGEVTTIMAASHSPTYPADDWIKVTHECRTSTEAENLANASIEYDSAGWARWK